MNAILKITDPSGNSWEVNLLPSTNYNIGRGKDNDIILDDRRASRRHAQIIAVAQDFKIIDGYYEGGEIKRSVNQVFINGMPRLEKVLESDDEIIIGETKLNFNKINEEGVGQTQQNKIESSLNPLAISANKPEAVENLNYIDQPLGHTQMLISAQEIFGNRSLQSLTEIASPEEVKELRRKAKVLDLLYEMSRTIGTVFDLKEVFVKATDLIFRGTPADRVVAMIVEDAPSGEISHDSLFPIAVRARDERMEKSAEKLSISRTITEKVMTERVALLSQDVSSDAQLSAAESIVLQGVRSTICAPLITESNVHGVIYADRLDPFSAFSQNDLELISAVAAQTAITVENVKAHKRLAREEVARANYSRFMPEYVVKQLLEDPNSFKLGGTNQTITILFADIRGFTAFSEREKPEKIVGILNRYFTAMTEIIFAHGGTLDKYIGDELMAIFGAPTATEKDAENAVKTAAAMQKRIVTLNTEFESEGFSPINVGIGLHTGEATVGYIGSEQRSEYTAIGDAVNVASRLQSNALGGQILISEATVQACGTSFDLAQHEPLTVKNRLQPVPLFEVKWN
jgi:adenylate cyclase